MLAATFVHNNLPQKDFAILLPGRGGGCTRCKFDCTGCIVHTVFTSPHPQCVCVTGIFSTNTAKVALLLVYHLMDCRNLSYKLYYRWFPYQNISLHAPSSYCL